MTYFSDHVHFNPLLNLSERAKQTGLRSIYLKGLLDSLKKQLKCEVEYCLVSQIGQTDPVFSKFNYFLAICLIDEA